MVTQPNGYRVVPYRVGTTAYGVMFDIFLNIAFLKRLTNFLKMFLFFVYPDDARLRHYGVLDEPY